MKRILVTCFVAIFLYGISLVCYAIDDDSTVEALELYSGTRIISFLSVNTELPYSVFIQYSDDKNNVVLSIKADIRELLPELGKFLENEIDSKHKGCRERWDGWGGSAKVEEQQLYLKVSAKLEKWLCESVLGIETKTVLLQESGTIHAKLKPIIKNERLHIELSDFYIKDLGEIAKALDVEKMLKNEMQLQLDEFNDDIEKTSLPDELASLGYKLTAIQLSEEEVLVKIKGPNRLIEIMRLFME